MMTKTSYSIAVLPGDGIGREVMAASLIVLHAVAARIDRRFDTVDHPAGAQHFLDSGVSLPEATLQACRKADAITGQHGNRVGRFAHGAFTSGPA